MLSFRHATVSDVPAIVRLVESAYRGEESRAGWTTEADLLDGQRTDTGAVAEMLRVPGSTVLLAEEDGGQLVSCCRLERRPGKGGPRAGCPEQRRHRERQLGAEQIARLALALQRSQDGGQGRADPGLAIVSLKTEHVVLGEASARRIEQRRPVRNAL